MTFVVVGPKAIVLPFTPESLELKSCPHPFVVESTKIGRPKDTSFSSATLSVVETFSKPSFPLVTQS